MHALILKKNSKIASQSVLAVGSLVANVETLILLLVLTLCMTFFVQGKLDCC